MKIKLLLSLLLLNICLMGQAGIGQWREHLSYRTGVAVCEAEELIYCAAFPSLFYFNTEDNSMEKFSKVEGISDLEINVVKYSKATKTVILGYSNGNIDLIVNQQIINVPDIKRSYVPGDKSINEILIEGNFAYLSTGFGIVQLDLQKREIKETFAFGPLGTYLQVNESCILNDTLYAATAEGIYAGNLNTNLADYQNWIKLSGIPEGNYNTIVNFQETLITNWHNDAWQEDTVYQYKNYSWGKIALGSTYDNYDINDLNVFGSELLVAAPFFGDVFNSDLSLKEHFHQYKTGYSPQPNEIIKTGTNYWFADNENGLAQCSANYSGNVYTPSGPYFSDCWGLDYSNGHLWLTTGSLTTNMKYNFSSRGIANFSDNHWDSYFGGSVFDSLRAIHSIAIDPDDPNHVFAASFGGGVLEFLNGQRVKIFNETNSTIQSISLFPFRGIGDVKFENADLLWVSNSGLSGGYSVENPLHAYDLNGNWYSFNLNNKLTGTNTFLSDIEIDQQGNKWLAAYLTGVLVFNENGTLGNTGDDSNILLTTGAGSGNLPSNEVHAIAIDEDGKVLIGTAAGLSVINSAANIFSPGASDAERIIITQNGEAAYLLSEEVINAIKIDAANRKWIATANNGVYLISADLQSEVYHFNSLNSPLLSDNVTDIEIDDKTGEVYFSTTKGLCSFMSGANTSAAYDGPVYAFPNPVPPNFNGEIGIRGLPDNAEVKITDVTGNLIYETIATGGTASWNGKSLNGDKAQSGVYLVFASNQDGSEKQVAKILFIN